MMPEGSGTRFNGLGQHEDVWDLGTLGGRGAEDSPCLANP